MLATSREALNVRGERRWPLLPLRLPESDPPGDDPHALSEAVELFCDRAHLVNAGENPAAQTAAEVAEICRRLDGIPLALELAAAWVPVLSLTEIAQRLDDSLATLDREAVGTARASSQPARVPRLELATADRRPTGRLRAALRVRRRLLARRRARSPRQMTRRPTTPPWSWSRRWSSARW